ncbi:spore maturation protein cgeB [Paenibacillus darwinianus]|uniref:Spore maturation protein cgeB n=1 Tax=Paenibacillus darwinianus TaxID=1380763 RepID=A0A9W5W792_9BACL|nr:glycosyltransferase [Paenibacillus darwinianus]EXX89085.1 spore maturation protein cgeB [Paenibacillus darwinianus]EXX89592.1 spore maturation protein cgeB [Paenibacillus darwinianus]EXX89808.1 spore maturation protein cgeB [Paenibacillus darwinianus]
MSAVSRIRNRRSIGLARIRNWSRGRLDGYAAGWRDGYRLGACGHAVRLGAVMPAVRPLHILFVATGKGFPYSPLDEAVTVTLKGMVARLTVTRKETVVRDAAALRPDLVLVLDGLDFDIARVDAIRALGLRTAIWFTDDPYYTDITSVLAQHFDDVFTLEQSCVEYYRSIGCGRVHHLPLGVHPAVFRPLNPPPERRRDICFVGSAYWNRVDFFDSITDYLEGKNVWISGIWWERLQNYKRLARQIELNKWMDPKETAMTYNGAKIVINLHRSPYDAEFNRNGARINAVSANPRTFEISACATLQMTDIRDGLSSCYVPGVEIETYASAEELTAKIDYYLANEEHRQAIALRGLYRTMRDHTYANRLDRMLSLLFEQ